MGLAILKSAHSQRIPNIRNQIQHCPQQYHASALLHYVSTLWKTVAHLLLHCEMAYWIWSFVFITFGLSWVVPRSIPDLLFGWWNWLGKHSSQIWNLVPLCIFWCIWKERNQRTFKDLDSSGDQMLASFSGTLFDWFRTWGLMTSDSLPSFISSLSLCN